MVITQQLRIHVSFQMFYLGPFKMTEIKILLILIIMMMIMSKQLIPCT